MKHRNVLRALTTAVMGLLVGAAAAVGGQVSNVRPAHAQVPPFTQCPPVGLDSSCAVLIVLGPGGSKTTLVDPAQPPFDGVEDTLIGVQNNSGGTVSSLDVSGSGIFFFDGDGLCTPTFGFPPPTGCPYGTTSYEGRPTAIASPIADTTATTFPAESFTIATPDSGTVNFLHPGPIPNGGSAYFSLEGPTSAIAPCVSGTPATVTLSPVTATNAVSTSHTVTASVKDLCGAGVSGATVTFTVTRVPPPGTSGTCTTDATGVCSFTYLGPILPATDAIMGCTPGAGGAPVCGAANKNWILPASACNGDITYGGHMIADNGNRVNFGGNAHSDQAHPPSGEETYVDKGANLLVKSISILAITCSAEKADIYGTATENGTGNHLFRIEVTDPDSSGGSDMYWIFLDNYNSGNHTIQGNVEIHST